MSGPLRVSGDLRDVDAALLVRSLARSRESGRLAVTDGDTTRHLFFKAGDLVFASSTQLDESLAAHLVRAGRVPFEALAVGGGGPGDADASAGGALVDAGYLRPDELVEAVSEQLLEIVHAVVAAERGRYLFDFSEVALKERIVLRRDVRAVLLAGMRRVRSVARVRRGLLVLAGRRWTAASAGATEPLALEPGEERLLGVLAGAGLDGAGPLPHVPGLTPWEVARSLWALHVVGCLEPADRRPATPAPHAAAPAAQPAATLGVPAADYPILAHLARFNARQERLWRVLRREVGEARDVFIRACAGRLEADAAALFAGVGLTAEGAWEAVPLLDRLRTLGLAGAEAALARLAESETESLARMGGAERARLLLAELDGEAAAGPATSTPEAGEGEDFAAPARPAGVR